eukprot:7257534-Prymnesium_polylepis.1
MCSVLEHRFEVHLVHGHPGPKQTNKRTSVEPLGAHPGAHGAWSPWSHASSAADAVASPAVSADGRVPPLHVACAQCASLRTTVFKPGSMG